MSTTSAEVVEMIATAEWKAWQSRPKTEKRRTPERFPPGWWVYDGFGAHGEPVDLIRRTGGGWLLLHWNAVGGPAIMDAEQQLVNLYEGLTAIPQNMLTPLGRWTTTALRQAIIDLYDPTIPEQAAARMLVALGAEVVVEPTAPQLDCIA